MYRLLAGATRRVNWRWLNEWKVAMGISLIAAGHTAAGKEAAPRAGADVKAPEAIHADTLRLPDERAKEEDALLISDPEVDAKPLFLGNPDSFQDGVHALFHVVAHQAHFLHATDVFVNSVLGLRPAPSPLRARASL